MKAIDRGVSITVTHEVAPAAVVLAEGAQIAPSSFLVTLHAAALALSKSHRRRREVLVNLVRAKTALAKNDTATLLPALWDAALAWGDINGEDLWRSGGRQGGAAVRRTNRVNKSKAARSKTVADAMDRYLAALPKHGEKDARRMAREASGCPAGTLRKAIERQRERESQP